MLVILTAVVVALSVAEDPAEAGVIGCVELHPAHCGAHPLGGMVGANFIIPSLRKHAYRQHPNYYSVKSICNVFLILLLIIGYLNMNKVLQDWKGHVEGNTQLNMSMGV